MQTRFHSLVVASVIVGFMLLSLAGGLQLAARLEFRSGELLATRTNRLYGKAEQDQTYVRDTVVRDDGKLIYEHVIYYSDGMPTRWYEMAATNRSTRIRSGDYEEGHGRTLVDKITVTLPWLAAQMELSELNHAAIVLLLSGSFLAVVPSIGGWARSRTARSPREPAALLQRAVASVIDLAVLGGLVLGCWVLFGGRVVALCRIVEIFPTDAAVLWSCAKAAVIFLFISLLYLALLVAVRGQTVGKGLAGTEVVRIEDGGPPGLWRSIIRSFGYLASCIPIFSGFWLAGIHPDRLGVHDYVAGTTVVRGARRVKGWQALVQAAIFVVALAMAFFLPSAREMIEYYGMARNSILPKVVDWGIAVPALIPALWTIALLLRNDVRSEA